LDFLVFFVLTDVEKELRMEDAPFIIDRVKWGMNLIMSLVAIFKLSLTRKLALRLI